MFLGKQIGRFKSPVSGFLKYIQHSFLRLLQRKKQSRPDITQDLIEAVQDALANYHRAGTFRSSETASSIAKEALSVLFEKWPHKKSLLAFVNRTKSRILWEIVQNNEESLCELYDVLDSIDRGKLISSGRERERFAIPSKAIIAEFCEILVAYHKIQFSSSAFETSHWDEFFRIEPIQRIFSRYGPDFVHDGRIVNLPGLRRQMMHRLGKCILPAEPLQRLREALVRLIGQAEPSTGLLLPSKPSAGKTTNEWRPEALFVTYQHDVNEGKRALYYAITIQMLSIPGQAGKPDFDEAFRIAQDIVETYSTYVRDSNFTGLFLGENLLSYWRFWALHDLLFSFIQYDVAATSYLTSKLLSQEFNNMVKLAFCNLVLHLPHYQQLFSDTGTMILNGTAFCKTVSEMNKHERRELCKVFLLDDPGRISSDLCEEFLHAISEPPPLRIVDFPPHGIREPINNTPSILKQEDGTLVLNAHQLTANWFFEKFYKEAKYPAPRIGHRFEEAIHSIFAKIGINSMKGHFEFEGRYFESDCICVHQNQTFAFEMKTKPFTVGSWRGETAALFIDFLKMFLKSQTQALRLWLALLVARRVVLYPGEHEARKKKGAIHEIVLHGDRISAITIIPFGPDFLTQPVVASNLIRSFSNQKIIFTSKNLDEDVLKEIKNLNTLQEEYQLVLSRLMKELSEKGETEPLRSIETACKLFTFSEIYTWIRLGRSPDKFFDLLKATFAMQTNDYKSHSKILNALVLCAHRWKSENKAG